jgi:hypothetical protein
MNDPAVYSWEPYYLSAALETDSALMPTRIYEALAAIELRRHSLLATDGIEGRAMENAQRGLLALKAERTASISDFSSDFESYFRSSLDSPEL